MKVLSLWTPWAAAIPRGLKGAETRPRPAPSTVIGQRIAIHASQTTKGITGALIPRGHPDATAESIARRQDLGQVGYRSWGELPLGVIVATAVVIASVPTERVFVGPKITGDWVAASILGTIVSVGISEREHRWGDYSPGRHVYLLSDIERLVEPVPFSGGQGWSKSWEPPESLAVERVEAA